MMFNIWHCKFSAFTCHFSTTFHFILFLHPVSLVGVYVQFLQQISLQKFDIRKRKAIMYIIFLYLFILHQRQVLIFYQNVCAFCSFPLPNSLSSTQPTHLHCYLLLQIRSLLDHHYAILLDEQYPEHLSISFTFLLLPITLISARCQTSL